MEKLIVEEKEKKQEPVTQSSCFMSNMQWSIALKCGLLMVFFTVMAFLFTLWSDMAYASHEAAFLERLRHTQEEFQRPIPEKLIALKKDYMENIRVLSTTTPVPSTTTTTPSQNPPEFSMSKLREALLSSFNEKSDFEEMPNALDNYFSNMDINEKPMVLLYGRSAAPYPNYPLYDNSDENLRSVNFLRHLQDNLLNPYFPFITRDVRLFPSVYRSLKDQYPESVEEPREEKEEKTYRHSRQNDIYIPSEAEEISQVENEAYYPPSFHGNVDIFKRRPSYSQQRLNIPVKVQNEEIPSVSYPHSFEDHSSMMNPNDKIYSPNSPSPSSFGMSDNLNVPLDYDVSNNGPYSSDNSQRNLFAPDPLQFYSPDTVEDNTPTHDETSTYYLPSFSNENKQETPQSSSDIMKTYTRELPSTTYYYTKPLIISDDLKTTPTFENFEKPSSFPTENSPMRSNSKPKVSLLQKILMDNFNPEGRMDVKYIYENDASDIIKK